MDNPEKPAPMGTQDEEKQNKNTTHYVLDTTMRQTNTNNVNKSLPRETANIGYTRRRNTKQKHNMCIVNKHK
jgi:hypothetical protein